MSIVQGPRPDVTPPQIIALATAGVPILSALLNAFGVYSLNIAQQAALNDAITWSGVVAASLIGGDAILRSARNARKAKVEAVLAEGGEGANLEIVDRVQDDESAAVATIPKPGPAAGFEQPPPPPPTA